MSEFDDFLYKNFGRTSGGSSYVKVNCPCPDHPDNNASLSIREMSDGISLKCFKGCDYRNIVDSLNVKPKSGERNVFKNSMEINDVVKKTLKMGELEDEVANAINSVRRSAKGTFAKDDALKGINTYAKETGRWVYCDRYGDPTLVVLRVECFLHHKMFLDRNPGYSGEVLTIQTGKHKALTEVVPDPTPSKKANKTFRPIYRDGELWTSRGKPLHFIAPVYNIVSVMQSNYVVVTEGEKAAQELIDIGICATTSAGGSSGAKKTDWTILKDKNVIFWPDNDSAGEEYIASIETILKLADGSCRPSSIGYFRPYEKAEQLGQDAADRVEELRNGPLAETEFAESLKDAILKSIEVGTIRSLRSIPISSTGVKELPLDAIPSCFQNWVINKSKCSNSMPDYIAAGAIAAASACIGHRVKFRPDKKDNFLIIPNLWGMVVGEPSQKKTGAARAGYKMMVEFDKKRLDAAMTELERTGELENIIKQNKNKSMEELFGRSVGVLNSNVSGLETKMCRSDRGIYYYRDEMSSLIKQTENDKTGAEKSFFLEAWEGANDINTVRTTVSSRSGEGVLTLTLFGTIQPDLLAELVMGASETNDGFFARLQLLVWPEKKLVIEDEKFHENVYDEEAEREAFDGMKRAFYAKLTNVSRPDNKGCIIDSDDEALALFRNWKEFNSMRNMEDHPSLYASYIGKLASLVGALAVINQVVDYGDGPVCKNSMKKAIKYCDYLESHMEAAIRAASINSNYGAILGEAIVKGFTSSKFTYACIMKNPKVRLKTRKGFNEAVDMLLEMKWLARHDEVVQGENGHEKTTYYTVNPEVLERGKELLCCDEDRAIRSYTDWEKCMDLTIEETPALNPLTLKYEDEFYRDYPVETAFVASAWSPDPLGYEGFGEIPE